jgi:zinc transport system substrate-binding protein
MTILLALTACKNTNVNACQFNDEDTIKICATLFPQYDFAKQIGGDRVEVKLLLKPGVESHSFEPTAADIVNLNHADLILYTNSYMEPWIEKRLANALENKNLMLVNSSKYIEYLESDHDHENDHNDEEEHEDEGEHGEEDEHLLDPHVWTSLHNASLMVDAILEAFIQIDPDNSDYYTQNAKNYKDKLEALDARFKDLFENSPSKTILHGGHATLGYFAHDYDLTVKTVFESYSPNEELKIANIKQFIDEVKSQANFIPVLYYEELIQPKTAEMIKKELEKGGITVELKMLHGLHNVSKSELENNVSYLSLMEGNYTNLKAGFDKDE